MNRLSKYLFILVILLFLAVMGYRYDEYILKRNFLITVNAVCNPSIESCFVADCETGPDCDESPYKKVDILAHNTPKCLEEHNCPNFSCANISNCEETYCSENTLSEGEKCLVLPTVEEATTTVKEKNN